jgi:hypothetical protein
MTSLEAAEFGQHSHLDASRGQFPHPLDIRFGQHKIRRLYQYFALHLAQPLAQRLVDDTDLSGGGDPGGILNQNSARCPDEIVPNLDQPRA